MEGNEDEKSSNRYNRRYRDTKNKKKNNENKIHNNFIF